jgi:cysteine-rich repeat protein
VCDDVHSLCVDPAQVTACSGAPDNQACSYPGVAQGVCAGGVCFGNTCGNGVLDPGEVCDGDLGVDASIGQTCSPDCRAIWMCGNGIVDPNETCDDGNNNPADGCDACRATTWQVSTVVGSDDLATNRVIARPAGLALDGQGGAFVTESAHHRVLHFVVGGEITIVAGSGAAGFSGDGGPAIEAQLSGPAGLALDGIGRLYIADSGNNRVRRVELNGTIVTVAGNGGTFPAGTSPTPGDGGAAIDAPLDGPSGVAVDGLGQLAIAEYGNGVRLVDPSGLISTIAPAGLPAGGGVANPQGVAFDSDGSVLVADFYNNRVARIVGSSVTTVVGSPLYFPLGVAVDAAGRILICDERNTVALFDGTSLTTVAGQPYGYGFAGDGGHANVALMSGPRAVAVDATNQVWIADQYNNRVRLTTGEDGTTSTISTAAGAQGLIGDGGGATAALLQTPNAAIFDATGRMLIADSGHNVIRRVELDGTMTTIAGTGVVADSGDGGPAIAAGLDAPVSLAIDAVGRILIADIATVRRIELDGTIQTIVGSLRGPDAVVVDAAGDVLIADTGDQKVLRVDTTGAITTIAGTGSQGYNGDGILATAAELNQPRGLAVDALGRVLIAEPQGCRIRRVTIGGNIETIAGLLAGTGTCDVTTCSSAVDGSTAAGGQLCFPDSLTIDGMGRVLFTQLGLGSNNHSVRRIELDGTLSTVAGAGSAGFAGDGGSATAAVLRAPNGVSTDPLGRVIFADSGNHVIRRIDVGTITTIAGAIDPERVGPVMTARLADPQAIVLGAGLVWSAGGTSGTVEAVRGGRVEAVAGRYPESTATTIGSTTLARFQTSMFGTVGGIAVDATNGFAYIAETSANQIDQIRLADPANPMTWTIVPLVGGAPGFADSPKTPLFRQPTGLLLDGTTLYVADTGNHAIRAIDVNTKLVTTVVNQSGSLGANDGAAAQARLYRPSALAKCSNGDFFIADTGNAKVRRWSAGAVSTVAAIDSPRGLGCDVYGDVIVSSAATLRLLAANDAGVVDAQSAMHTIYSSGATFPASVTRCLTGVAILGPTTIQVADACTGLLLQLDRVATP